MGDKTREIDNPQEPARGTFMSYTIGFLLSLLLTLTAYMSVVNHGVSHNALLALIVGLAVVQLLVQLVFFLHLGRESRPRLNLVVFLFMLLVLGILVIGSLWIMHNLNYHMSSQDMNHQLLEQYNRGGL